MILAPLVDRGKLAMACASNSKERDSEEGRTRENLGACGRGPNGRVCVLSV